MAISTYAGNKVIDLIFNNTAFTPPATVYISLHTGDPGLTGASEVSGGSYARVSASFSAAGSKATENDAIVQFATATLSWGTVTHWGVWDASSAGNFLWGGALDASRTISANDTAHIAALQLDIALN